MNGLSVCTGIGGIELGLKLALGDSYRTVGYVERDAYAASVLVARMADAALDRAPIWDDLTTFDGRAWRGKVDLVTSGLPCQPYSVAGKQRGHADERALWPHFVRVVREAEPAVVFLENVPPFLKHFEPVWRELRGMGFDIAPPLLHTASEAGAPHIRRRLFVLAAHRERSVLRHESWRRGWAGGRGAWEPRDGADAPADDDDARLEGRRVSGRERADERAARALHSPAAEPDDDGREGEWSGWVLDSEWETLRHDAHGLRDGCRICGSPWEAESPPVRVDDGTPVRVDELRAVGNAVVPLVAARAFTLLAGHLAR